VINSLNSQTPATGGEANPQHRQELRQAAQAFEAVFIRQLIGSMRSAKLADDMFGSQATEQFRDMADSRLADSMAQQGTFGIAELLTAQFERHRSVQAPQTGAAAGNQTGANAGDNRNNDEVTR
jgi:flagellar protein FlgJ